MSKRPKKNKDEVKCGEFVVRPETNGDYRYWTAFCRRKLIDDENQRRRFSFDPEGKKKAVSFAWEQNEIYSRRKQLGEAPIPEIDRQRFHLLTDKVDQFRVKEFEAGFTGKGGERWDTWDLDKAVETAHFIIRNLQRMNKAHGEFRYTVNDVINIFFKQGNADLYEKRGKEFGAAIDEFLRFKRSPVGGKSRKPLSKKSVKEWEGMLGYLKKWIGSSTIKEKNKLQKERKIILDRIDNQFDKRKGFKPKPWSPCTKKKCADKIKQFGDWITKDEQGWCKSNPFDDLPSQYAYKKDFKIFTFKNEEVKEIFRTALRDSKLHESIPYLAFSFFAGLRPHAEIASPEDATRRFLWKQFLGKRWPDTNGYTINIPAMIDGGQGLRKATKISYSRHAELSENGYAWLVWWRDNVLKGAFPTGNTEIVFSPKGIAKVHKIPNEWGDDGARHTFFSNAVNHWRTLGVAYWNERAGHDERTFRKYYSNPVDPCDAQEYFNITPQSLLEENH